MGARAAGLARLPGDRRRIVAAPARTARAGGWAQGGGDLTMSAVHVTVGAMDLAVGATGRRVPRCPATSYSCALARDVLRGEFHGVRGGLRALRRPDSVPRYSCNVVVTNRGALRREVIVLRQDRLEVQRDSNDLERVRHAVPSGSLAVRRGRRVLRCEPGDVRRDADLVRQVHEVVCSHERRDESEPHRPDCERHRHA